MRRRIVFLENCDLKPVDTSRALHELEYAGWFRDIDALLLGRSSGPDADSETSLSYVEAVQHAVGHLRRPVLMDVDTGHRAPQMTLVQGALAQLSWSDRSGAVLVQTLS